MSDPITEPAAQPLPEITQPNAPPPLTKQTFKCEKCGATFEDESSATAHIQECKGSEVIPPEQEPKKA